MLGAPSSSSTPPPACSARKCFHSAHLSSVLSHLADVDLCKLIQHTEKGDTDTSVFSTSSNKTKTDTRHATKQHTEAEEQRCPLKLPEELSSKDSHPHGHTVGVPPRSAAADHAHSLSLGVVGIGKHVCGGATDLSLVALHNYLHDSTQQDVLSPALTSAAAPPSSSSSSSSSSSAGTLPTATCAPRAPPPRVKGIALALCCHGLCSWDCYVGRAWLASEGHFTATEFDVLRKWSGFFVVDNGQVTVDNNQGTSLEKDGNSHHFNDFASRANLGKMCKRVIDFGRVHYIRTQLKMSARLVRFIDDSTTPENVLLLAY